MTTKEKPAPGWRREAGLIDAFEDSNDTPFALRLKAVLLALVLYDAALLALLVLLAFGGAK